MAVLAGKNGKVQLTSNVVAELDQWQLDIQLGLEETQAFGDSWKERTNTVNDWSASAQGRFDPSDTNGQAALMAASIGGTTVAARFYVDGSHYYSGNAFVQLSVTAPENGVVTATYNFTGSGALSYT